MREASLRTRRTVAVAVVGLILLALVAWAVTYTPIFEAHHIKVVGAQTLRPDTIRELAGLDGSTNVVHLDTDAVAGRLLSNPWIASATVERDLPETLVVQVVERRPVATVPAMGEGSILASDGSVLPATDAVPALPTMHAAVGVPDDAQRMAAAALLSALDPVVAGRVRDITVGQDGLVTMRLRNGVTVDAGGGGQEEAKAAALRAILRWSATDGRGLTSIDVSAPSAPGATLADGSTVTP